MGALTYSVYKQWKREGWDDLFAARYFYKNMSTFFSQIQRYSQHPNVVREQAFHSEIISSDEESSPSATPNPSAPPAASKPASKAHNHRSLSIGNVAAELLAGNSQLLKVTQETNKTKIEILQSKEERADRKLRLDEEKMKIDKEIREKEMKVKQAQAVVADVNLPEEVRKKASDYLVAFFSF
jgi:hypothetical protein